LATLLAYAGLRISEVRNIQLTNFNLTVGELKVRGKEDKYSNKITPHILRHLFLYYCFRRRFFCYEVAYLAGHSNVHTALLYLNLSRE